MSVKNVGIVFSGGLRFGFNSMVGNTLGCPTYRRCWQDYNRTYMLRTERYTDKFLNMLRRTKKRVLDGWLVDRHITGKQIEKDTIINNGKSITSIVEDRDGIRTISNSALSINSNEVSITNTLAQKNHRNAVHLSGDMTKIYPNGISCNYELCYNPESGMHEFVCLKANKIGNEGFSIGHNFNAEEGIEVYSVNAENPIGKPIYQHTSK